MTATSRPTSGATSDATGQSRRGRPTADGFEQSVRADLVARRWLRLHVCLIALTTFAACWGLSALLLRLGVGSLALRHGVALLGAYLLYLGLMHVWACALLWRETKSGGGPGPGDAIDALELAFDAADALRASNRTLPVFRAGGGGRYGGGGASGSWPQPSSSICEGAGEAMGSVFRAAGDADEGALVVVPLAVVVGVALLLAGALGFAVFGLFGVDLLVGVAVEIAFASAGGALALRARREGWLGHVLRRTAAPMAGVLVATLLAGLAIGHWLPDARTLGEALRLLLAAP